MLFEYIEILPSFHRRRRDGRYVLGEPQLTLTINLIFKLSCAKFVFLSSEKVKKVAGIRLLPKKKAPPRYCLQFSLLHFSLFFIFGWLVGLVLVGFGFCFLFPGSVPR